MNRSCFEKALYRVENSAVLACIGLFAPSLGIGAVTWKNVLVLAAVLALFAGINFLPVRGKVLCLLLTAVCLSVPAGLIGLRRSYEFFQVYFQWCMGYSVKQKQWLDGFCLIHTAVITAAAFPVQILLEKCRILKVVTACAFAGSMLFCLFARVSLPHMYVVFVLFYIVTVYAEWLQEHWKKKRSGSLKAQMLWISPFLSIYLLLMAVMPVPEKPYDWQWVKNIYAHVKESFLAVSQNLFRGGREDFGTALSGFSGDGELGGDVSGNGREIMLIRAQNNNEAALYLIGKVYDTFDGRQWLQEYHGEEKERFTDTMETLYAVRRLDDRYRRDYVREANIRIRYEFFNTGYVFAPLKTGSIQGSGPALKYFFKGGDLLFKSGKGYGTEYDVEYYQINMGEELFERLLETVQTPDEALWEEIAGEYEEQVGQRITFEMLEAHRQSIYGNYLDRVVLSGEAETYLSGIIGEAGSNLEKLQAIERELGSYTYTRQPGNLPDRVTNAGEFLDYFLLESRQGYCAHFATAFVLLARAQGIPARYVQGFCVPMDGSGEAVVSSDMAHSWPEVYMEDVGWIPFEPTPGYETFRYMPWEVSVRGSSPSYETDNADEKEREDVFTGPEKKPETDGKPEGQKSEKETGLALFRRGLLFGIPAVLAGAVLVLLTDNLLARRRYRKMDLVKKLKTEVRRNFRLLSWLGLKRGENETLQELYERGILIQEMTSLRFIKDYEDVLYGGKGAEEEMLERVKKEREQLWKLHRKKKKLTYISYRVRMFLAGYR